MKKKIELTMKDLRESQKIRRKMRNNENHIRKLLSQNDNLRNELVRTVFKIGN